MGGERRPGMEALRRYPRSWCGRIWASQNEAGMPRESVEKVAGWAEGAPLRCAVEFESSLVSGGVSRRAELNFGVVPDEASRNQLVYAYRSGLALALRRGLRWFALCDSGGALVSLPVDARVGESMLRLPNEVIIESENREV